MIRAVIFDMDGVLVQTERLKALSYARAVEELCPGRAGEAELVSAYGKVISETLRETAGTCPTVSESDVITMYKEVVGRSRQEVAEALVKRFGLEDILRPKMAELGVSNAGEALVHVRMPIYKALLADPETVKNSQWLHNVTLLHRVRKEGYRTALGTMSDRKQTERILEILGLTASLDLVVTIDDVTHGKPDPEIYLLISQRLGIPLSECLVFEDSPSGVTAGKAAGMWVISATTPFTRKAVHDAKVLDEQWIVDDPARLPEAFQQMVNERQRD